MWQYVYTISKAGISRSEVPSLDPEDSKKLFEFADSTFNQLMKGEKLSKESKKDIATVKEEAYKDYLQKKKEHFFCRWEI